MCSLQVFIYLMTCRNHLTDESRNRKILLPTVDLVYITFTSIFFISSGWSFFSFPAACCMNVFPFPWNELFLFGQLFWVIYFLLKCMSYQLNYDKTIYSVIFLVFCWKPYVKSLDFICFDFVCCWVTVSMTLIRHLVSIIIIVLCITLYMLV